MIVEGLLLGLAYVLPPGPVTTETVRRSLRGGLPAALAVQLGAVAGDFVYALLILAGLATFLKHPAAQTTAGLLGAALLLALGISALRTSTVSQEPLASDNPPGAPASLCRLAGIGLFVSLMNPFAAGFWITVGSTAATTHTWLAGFMTGSLLASLFTALLVGQLQMQRHGRWSRRISVACGGLLIAFSLKLGWTMVGHL